MQWHDCPICHETPRGLIHQCQNGHFCCEECFTQVTMCPSCRVAVDRLNPIRALGVEQAISSLPITCPHDECGFVTTRGALTAHERDCPRRQTSCLAAESEGCAWKGLVSDAEAHAAACPHALIFRTIAPLQRQLTLLTEQSIQQQQATQALHQQISTQANKIQALETKLFQAQERDKKRRTHEKEHIYQDLGWFPVHFRVYRFFKQHQTPDGDYYPVSIDEAIFALGQENYEPQDVIDAADQVITQDFLCGTAVKGYYIAIKK